MTRFFRIFAEILRPETSFYWLAVVYGIGISLLTLATPISVQMLINTVANTAMPAPLLRIWHRRGVALSQGYGLTEASPNVLCLANEDAARMLGYSGKPYPHVAVAVADPVTGEILDGAASGELLVGGPGVFAGYFRDPAATAAVLAGGWLRTGDLVERDAEGYIKVVDRLKDIYISGGENVAPAEVEAALLAHPAVAQAAVVGVEDERWGETGVAFVVIRPGLAADEQELLDHCAAQLAHFKVPARIETVGALPRTALNKVLRARLRQQLDERREAGRAEIPAVSLHADALPAAALPDAVAADAVSSDRGRR